MVYVSYVYKVVYNCEWGGGDTCWYVVYVFVCGICVYRVSGGLND